VAESRRCGTMASLPTPGGGLEGLGGGGWRRDGAASGAGGAVGPAAV
jgi:hypothetical protein